MTASRSNIQIAAFFIAAIVGSAMFMAIPYISVWSGLIKAPSALQLWAASFMTLFTRWFIYGFYSRYMHEWGTSSCGTIEGYARTAHGVLLVAWSGMMLFSLASILTVGYNHLEPLPAWNISAMALVACAPSVLVEFVVLLRGK